MRDGEAAAGAVDEAAGFGPYRLQGLLGRGGWARCTAPTTRAATGSSRYSVELGYDFSGYKPTAAGDGARYVVVEARVLNDTQESISPGCGGGLTTAVVDDRGRRFDRISEINQLRGNADACAPAVQPGFTTTVTYAFKVPTSTDITRFVFRDQAAFKLPDADSTGVDLGLTR